MPVWDAVTVHVPVVRNAVGMHTEGVVDAKPTFNPDEAMAARTGVVPNAWLPGLLNVMLCVAAVTENDCVTGVAAAKFALPACVAVIVQVPAPNSAAVVQMEGLPEPKLTGNPEDAVADSTGVPPTACGPGFVKVIVWLPAET